MFDISWSELLLIGVVALVAIGPKELPGVLRMLGQWMAKLRRMAAEFQSQFQEAMREAEMADLKKQVDDLASTAKGYANFDPVSEVSREFESAKRDIESAIETPTSSTHPSEAAPTPTAHSEPALAPPGSDTAVADAAVTAPATAAPAEAHEQHDGKGA
jgi:sec-independent protein translocase protein TatB